MLLMIFFPSHDMIYLIVIIIRNDDLMQKQDRKIYMQNVYTNSSLKHQQYKSKYTKLILHRQWAVTHYENSLLEISTILTKWNAF